LIYKLIYLYVFYIIYQIYYHSKKKYKDLIKLLDDVELGYLNNREGGLDSTNDWNDILSGIF
jgi:ABC-type uncharacterized transport system fused permease/ATPase subunit